MLHTIWNLRREFVRQSGASRIGHHFLSDNNSGSTTAAKILVSFRPDFDLGPRWTHKRPSRSSNPPADDWSKRGLTTVTEDSTTTITNYNNYLTNWNSNYRLPYSTQSQLLPTEEPTKRVTKLVTNINKNWRDFNITKTKDDKEPTTTGSGTSLPVP